jgi:hypothetical protein
VKAVVTNVEEDLAKQNKCVTPFTSNYAPWLEESPELKTNYVQRFQELIGQLRWAVDIRRVDILLETSLLSSYLAMPRVGHLEQAFHIFGYLKTHPMRKLAFDPSHPDTNEKRFQECDWSEFYRDATEAFHDLSKLLPPQVAIATLLSASRALRYPEGYHFLDLLHPIQAYHRIHIFYI